MAQETQQGLCINLKGWGGDGDGRELQKVYMYTLPFEGMHIHVADSS